MNGGERGWGVEGEVLSERRSSVAYVNRCKTVCIVLSMS